MKRFWVKIFLILLSLFLLSGCRKQHDDTLTPLNLTKSITINCQHRGHPLVRTYTDPDKIDVILIYLHRLSHGNQLIFPLDHPGGDRCEITLHLWNGTVRSYELRNKDALQNYNGNWYYVEPEKANILYHLIEHIESDEPRVSQMI